VPNVYNTQSTLSLNHQFCIIQNVPKMMLNQLFYCKSVAAEKMPLSTWWIEWNFSDYLHFFSTYTISVVPPWKTFCCAKNYNFSAIICMLEKEKDRKLPYQRDWKSKSSCKYMHMYCQMGSKRQTFPNC